MLLLGLTRVHVLRGHTSENFTLVIFCDCNCLTETHLYFSYQDYSLVIFLCCDVCLPQYELPMRNTEDLLYLKTHAHTYTYNTQTQTPHIKRTQRDDGVH